MYALIGISNQMLGDSAFDTEGEIRGEAVPQYVTHTWKSTLMLGVSMPVQRTLQDRRVALFAKGCCDDLLPKLKPYTIVSAV